MNGRLYAFRLTSTSPVYVLVGHSKAWIKNATIAAQHKVDLADVALIDSSSPLWLIPTIGEVP